MRWEQEEEDIRGGVSDERQLKIRRKRKKIQEKLSDGMKEYHTSRTNAVSKGVRTAQ